MIKHNNLYKHFQVNRQQLFPLYTLQHYTSSSISTYNKKPNITSTTPHNNAIQYTHNLLTSLTPYNNTNTNTDYNTSNISTTYSARINLEDLNYNTYQNLLTLTLNNPETTNTDHDNASLDTHNTPKLTQTENTTSGIEDHNTHTSHNQGTFNIVHDQADSAGLKGLPTNSNTLNIHTENTTSGLEDQNTHTSHNQGTFTIVHDQADSAGLKGLPTNSNTLNTHTENTTSGLEDQNTHTSHNQGTFNIVHDQADSAGLKGLPTNSNTLNTHTENTTSGLEDQNTHTSHNQGTFNIVHDQADSAGLKGLPTNSNTLNTHTENTTSGLEDQNTHTSHNRGTFTIVHDQADSAGLKGLPTNSNTLNTHIENTTPSLPHNLRPRTSHPPPTPHPPLVNTERLNIPQLPGQSLLVADSTHSGAGRGLFSDQPVYANDFICTYKGTSLHSSQLPLPDDFPRYDYVWSNSDSSIIIDAFKELCCWGRFTNDAADEHGNNAQISQYKTKVFVRPTRDIARHEEICTPYGAEYWADRFHLLSLPEYPHHTPFQVKLINYYKIHPLPSGRAITHKQACTNRLSAEPTGTMTNPPIFGPTLSPYIMDVIRDTYGTSTSNQLSLSLAFVSGPQNRNQHLHNLVTALQSHHPDDSLAVIKQYLHTHSKDVQLSIFKRRNDNLSLTCTPNGTCGFQFLDQMEQRRERQRNNLPPDDFIHLTSPSHIGKHRIYIRKLITQNQNNSFPAVQQTVAKLRYYLQWLSEKHKPDFLMADWMDSSSILHLLRTAETHISFVAQDPMNIYPIIDSDWAYMDEDTEYPNPFHTLAETEVIVKRDNFGGYADHHYNPYPTSRTSNLDTDTALTSLAKWIIINHNGNIAPSHLVKYFNPQPGHSVRSPRLPHIPSRRAYHTPSLNPTPTYDTSHYTTSFYDLTNSLTPPPLPSNTSTQIDLTQNNASTKTKLSTITINPTAPIDPTILNISQLPNLTNTTIIETTTNDIALPAITNSKKTKKHSRNILTTINPTNTTTSTTLTSTTHKPSDNNTKSHWPIFTLMSKTPHNNTTQNNKRTSQNFNVKLKKRNSTFIHTTSSKLITEIFTTNTPMSTTSNSETSLTGAALNTQNNPFAPLLDDYIEPLAHNHIIPKLPSKDLLLQPNVSYPLPINPLLTISTSFTLIQERTSDPLLPHETLHSFSPPLHPPHQLPLHHVQQKHNLNTKVRTKNPLYLSPLLAPHLSHMT